MVIQKQFLYRTPITIYQNAAHLDQFLFCIPVAQPSDWPRFSEVYLYSNILAVLDLSTVETSFQQTGAIDLPHGVGRR